ncbi:MAG: Mur ligase domain-containing protein [Clostridia bacterium]
MPNIDSIRKYKNIHMIGIGGVSMSGIAAILKNWGFTVTGSDSSDSEAVQNLLKKGIKVVIGHSLEDVANSDVVVYSAAIKQDDPEMLEANRLNIPTIERADFLGELTRCYEDTICISGTHGKTTTTSMISLCFLEGLKIQAFKLVLF